MPYEFDATKLKSDSGILEANTSSEQWWNRLITYRVRNKFMPDGSFQPQGGPLNGKQIVDKLGPKEMADFWDRVVNKWESSIRSNQERNIAKLGDMSKISVQTIDWVLKTKHGLEKATFATTLADFLVNNSLLDITKIKSSNFTYGQGKGEKTRQVGIEFGADNKEIIGYSRTNGKVDRESLLRILTGGTVNDISIDKFDVDSGGEGANPSKPEIKDKPDKQLNNAERAEYDNANKFAQKFALEAQSKVLKIIAHIVRGYLGTANSNKTAFVMPSKPYDETMSLGNNQQRHDKTYYALNLDETGLILNQKQTESFRNNMKLTTDMVYQAIVWGHGYMILSAQYLFTIASNGEENVSFNSPDGSGYTLGKKDSLSITKLTRLYKGGKLYPNDNARFEDGGLGRAVFQEFMDPQALKELYDKITDEYNVKNGTPNTPIVPRKDEHPWGRIPNLITKSLPNTNLAGMDTDGDGKTNPFDAALGKQNEALDAMKNAFTPTEITGTPSQIAARKKKFFNNILQCILLAGTPALQKLSDALRADSGVDGGQCYPYGGRVIPVDIKEQENFINALTLPAFAKPAFKKGNVLQEIAKTATINDYLQSTKHFNGTIVTKVGLYKVIKNYKYKGKMKNEGRPIAFPLNFKVGWPVPNFRERNPISVFQGGQHNDIIQGSRPEYIEMKSIDINFKGGTIATAKSDVECTIVFELQDISFLEQAYRYRLPLDNEEITYQFTFLDLISYTNKNNTSTGFASSVRQQYHPDYNRLLLKANIRHQPIKGKERVSNWEKINNVLETVPMVLDLALVDHTIDKSDVNRSAKITIHYRGWVDSMLSDPSQDALASNEVFRNRIFREIGARRLINGGCNYEQIKNFYAETGEEAKAEAGKTMADIVRRLDDTQRLFKLYIRSSFVQSALSSDQSYIVDGSPINAEMERIILSSEFKTGTYDPTSNVPGNRSSVTNTTTGVCLYKKIWSEAYDATDKKAKENLKKARQAILKKDNISINFFFLGDLLSILLDNQYEPNSRFINHKAHTPLSVEFQDEFVNSEKEDDVFGGGYYFNCDPVKIITPTFEWTYPDLSNKTSKYSQIRTNIADIPISLEWFTDWFRREIIDKNLNYYPIGTFVKSVAHTIVSRLINEICFGLVSEQKVLFKARHETGVFASHLESGASRTRRKNLELRDKNEFGFNHKWLSSKNYKLPMDTTKYQNMPMFSYKHYKDTETTMGCRHFPLLKKDYNNGPDEYCNFIIIYPANTNSFSKFSDGKTTGSGIPHFQFKKPKYDFLEGRSATIPKPEKSNLIKKLKFTKTEAKYRRESRFFASNMGSLAQIAGVYNATMHFHKPVFFLYPGQLCWIDAGLKDGPSEGKESIAFILGLGGYHQIVDVKHAFKFNSGQLITATTTVEAYWVNHGVNNKMVEKFKHGKNNTPEEGLTESCMKAFESLPELALDWYKRKTKENSENNKAKTNAKGSEEAKKKPKPKSTKKSKKRRKARNRARKKQNRKSQEEVVALQSDQEELERLDQEQFKKDIENLRDARSGGAAGGYDPNFGESLQGMSESEKIAAAQTEDPTLAMEKRVYEDYKAQEKAERERLDKMQEEAEKLAAAQYKAQQKEDKYLAKVMAENAKKMEAEEKARKEAEAQAYAKANTTQFM